MRVCVARLSPTIVYEVIQPISGTAIFQEFLDQHGEGEHHIAYEMNGIPFEQREKEFEKMGFVMSQGGSWLGKIHFAFFETEEQTGMCFETLEFSCILGPSGAGRVVSACTGSVGTVLYTSGYRLPIQISPLFFSPLEVV